LGQSQSHHQQGDQQKPPHFVFSFSCRSESSNISLVVYSCKLANLQLIWQDPPFVFISARFAKFAFSSARFPTSNLFWASSPNHNSGKLATPDVLYLAWVPFCYFGLGVFVCL
jgi:hypothetical protein